MVRFSKPLFLTVALALCLGLPAAAQAVALNGQIGVFNATTATALGTASGGGATLILTSGVDFTAGDTLEFTYGIDQATSGYTSYATNVTRDNSSDTGELIWVSGTELSGLGFNFFGDPNTTFGGGPGQGTVSSQSGGNTTTTSFYRLTYTVGTVATDGTADLSITATTFVPTGSDSLNLNTANVRLDAGAAVPEPATLLLLGSGLAGLAGFGRRLR